MKKSFWFFCLFCLAAPFVTVEASEVRVDSAGSLSLVTTDETTDITPYNLGNPAGLGLLAPEGLVGLDMPWYSVSNKNGSSQQNYFGVSMGVIETFPNMNAITSPLNSTAGSQYQGFLYVTPDKWSVQASGGYLDNEYSYGIPGVASGIQGGEQLVAVAHDWGPFTVGANLLFSQSGTTTFTQSAGVLNMGLLANFQLGDNNHPQWLRLGGSFSLNVLQPQEISSYNFSPNSISTSDLITSGSVFEPCLFFEIPGIFQGGVVGLFNNSTYINSISYTNNAAPDVPAYTSYIDNNFDIAAIYKWKIILSNSEKSYPLSLNQGALFQVTNSQGTDFNSDGSIWENFQETTLKAQAGLGLEREKDFTAGFQLNWQGFVDNFENQTDIIPGNNNLYTFGFSFGGEKWISSHWALRMGLLYDDHNYNGSLEIDQYFYLIGASQDFKGLMITPGIGYEDKGLKVDGMVWFEQPSGLNTIILNTANPADEYKLFGIELAATVYFDR